MNRRALLAATALLPLAACISATNGSITTATINVATVDAYAQAAGKAAALIVAVAGPAIGPAGVAIVNMAVTAITVAAANFDKAAGGSLTVTVDNASLKSLVATIAADAQQVVQAAGMAFTGTGLSGADQANAQTYIMAFQTAVALLQALVSQVGAPKPPLTSDAMFRAVGMAPRP